MKTTTRLFYFVLGVLAVIISGYCADPVVSNVRSSQRSGTKLVDITYDVSDADSSTLTISAAVSTNAGVTFDLPATHFSGSGYGVNVTPGTGKQIVWDAGADWNGQYSTLMRIKVTADDGIEPVIPPDPATVASAPSNGVVTLMGAATAFLYTGPNPIQTGVAAGTIQLARSAVLRGRIMTRDGVDLAGVTVSVNQHSEFGQTISRTNGMYDLAVNGGNVLQLNYRKTGYLPVQRPLQVPWQDFVHVDDVAMIPADTNVTVIFLSPTNTAMQSAVGSWASDTDGVRRAAVLFPTGVLASIYTYAGTTQSVDTLTVRLTEYTVGTNGQNAMPGELGATVAYTYAVELGADEAQAKINGKDVLFSTSVFFYVDNFLGMPAGMIVPAGYYDRERACWIPAPNGLVVQCLGTNSAGQVEMDTDGGGTADSPAVLAALGITDQERSLIAVTFSPTQSLWRTPVTHFSTFDCNYGWGYDEANMTKPNNGKNFINSQVKPDEQTQTSDTLGTIDLDGQIFREAIPIACTPYSLHYSSERMGGYYSALNIPLIGSTVPSGLLKIKLEVGVAGRNYSYFFDPLPSQSYDFEWDGLDIYGRSVSGNQTVSIRIAYQYQAYYYYPPYMNESFGYSSGVKIISNIPARLWWSDVPSRSWVDEEFTTTIRYISPVMSQKLDGWTLNVHHNYDPVSRRIDLGTGGRQSAAVLLRDCMVMETVAGIGSEGYSGDGGPATNAAFTGLGAVRLSPDGSYYIADAANYRVRRVNTNGIITTVAGNGDWEYSGDGGPATSAGLGYIDGLALAPDGSFYIACYSHSRVRRVDTNGIIATVAGNGVDDSTGDGGAATNASLRNPGSIAVSDDGSWYVTEPERIRRVGANGIIQTVVGNGTWGSSGDGGPATNATIGMVDGGIALSPDGSLYLADGSMGRVRRVDPHGIIHAFAGGSGSGGDGGAATNAALTVPVDLAIDADGGVYIADYWRHVVRYVDVNGVIYTVAGVSSLNGASGGYGGPATIAELKNPSGIGIAPDGNLYVADSGNGYIRSVLPKLSGVNYTSILTPSQDGQWIYEFDEMGRHIQTWNALTCAKVLEFSYSNGFLTAVTDGDGLTTAIERNASGTPTAVRGPYGQHTILTMNAAGLLASVENPASQKTELFYTSAGMLTNVVGAKGSAYAYRVSYTAGRVSRGVDPAGGGDRLSATTFSNGYQVAVTTAMGCARSIRVEDLAAGGRRRVETASDGSTFEKIETVSKCESNYFADGSATVLQWGPDPRFGMQSPLSASNSVRSPAGLILTASVARVVAWNGISPLTMTGMTTREVTNGRTNTSVYVTASRTTAVTTPAGRQTYSTTDSQGRPVSTRVTGLETLTNTYDGNGRLINQTMGNRTATWSYDAAGFVAQTGDAAGRTNQFAYDAVGHITNQVLPGNRTLGRAYDAHGNLTALTPPGCSAHSFDYNLVDLLSAYTPPAVAGVAAPATYYTYNLDRQLVLVTRPDSRTISNRYDSAGRQIAQVVAEGQYTNAWLTNGLLGSVTSSDGVTFAYKYDGFLVKTMEWSGTLTGQITLAYDNDFRPISQGLNGSAIPFGYDADSLLTNAGACAYRRSAQNTLLAGTALGVVTDACGYNGFGEITAYSTYSNGTTIFSRQYARDQLGRITNVVEINNGIFLTNDYSYDAAGRLSQVATNGTGTNVYYYDSNGNRTNWQQVGVSLYTAQYDGQDRLTNWTGATNQFNAAGDLTNRVVNGLTNAYQYNALGYLIGAVLPGGTNIIYRVDGLGRRVAKLVDGVFTQGWLYADGLLPVAELNHQSNVVSRFVYCKKDYTPDYMVRAGTTYRIITDQVGSPRLVMDSTSGTIVQEMEYDEFGRVLRDTSPGFQPFGFAGGLYDRDVGLVRFGGRDYDPATGRWTAKDPILFSGGDANLYCYVMNNPINQRDANGLGPNQPRIAVATVVGNTGNVYIRPGGSGPLQRAEPGTPIYPGDVVVTAAGSGAVVEYTIGGKVAIGETSGVKITGDREYETIYAPQTPTQQPTPTWGNGGGSAPRG